MNAKPLLSKTGYALPLGLLSVGVLVSIPISLMLVVAESWAEQRLDVPVTWFLVLTYLLVIFSTAMRLSFSFHGIVRCGMLGACLGFGVGVGDYPTSLLRPSTSVLESSSIPAILISAAVSGVFVGGLGACIAMMGYAVRSLCFFRSLPIVATACASCGYDLRGIQGDRCPECGRGNQADVVPLYLRILKWLGAHWLVVVVIFTVFVGIGLANRRGATQAVTQRLESVGGGVTDGAQFFDVLPNGSVRFTSALASWRDIGDGYILIMAVPEDGSDSSCAMQVQLGRFAVSPDGRKRPCPTPTLIYANLTSEMVADMAKNGPPVGMVNAMRAAAASLPPAEVQVGPLTVHRGGESMIVNNGKAVFVDPVLHF